MHSTVELSTGSRQSVASNEPACWVSETYPVLPFPKQIPNSDSSLKTSKRSFQVYKFRLSKNGKLSWWLAEVFAAVDRILQKSAAFTAAAIFPADFRRRQKCGGSGYSAAARHYDDYDDDDVPPSQQNLVSTLTLQPLEMRRRGWCGHTAGGLIQSLLVHDVRNVRKWKVITIAYFDLHFAMSYFVVAETETGPDLGLFGCFLLLLY